MPKSREKKSVEVKHLSESLQKSKAVVFTTQKGISVKAVEGLRRELKSHDAELTAVKKTLLNLVAKEQSIDLSGLSMDAGVSLAFSYGDEVTAAKTVYNFSKKNEGMAIVGGMLEGQVISAEKVMALAKLPGKQELLGQLVGTLQAPVSGFVNVLAANLRGLVNVLNAVKESKS